MSGSSSSRTEFPGELVASCCGSAVQLWRGAPGGGFAAPGAPVPHAAPVAAVAWNRNNKVVATAGASGAIQLCYSSGEVMSGLPRDGAPQGPLTSLAWSLGSKRLAAGSSDGSVYVHDMTTKVGGGEGMAARVRWGVWVRWGGVGFAGGG